MGEYCFVVKAGEDFGAQGQGELKVDLLYKE